MSTPIADDNKPRGHDNGTPSNDRTLPAQGEEGRREDQSREPASRIKGPGFGKGSNAVANEDAP